MYISLRKFDWKCYIYTINPLCMKKLYKIIVLFVGLIAMNISVQAQLGVLSSYFSPETITANDISIANEDAVNFAVQFSNEDWAGLSTLVAGKEAINFTNYPNPAITSTTIAYTLTAKAAVNLRVIDLAGKQLAVLIKQEQVAGKQEFYWELAKNNITSGMYILILQVENKVYSRKIIVQ